MTVKVPKRSTRKRSKDMDAYYKATATGLCGQCKKSPSTQGTKTCQSCRDTATARRNYKRANGICLNCASMAASNSTICQPCLDRSNALKELRKSAGCCVTCSKPAPDGTKCTECKSQTLQQIEARKKAGICVQCSAAAAKGRYKCQVCLDAVNKRNADKKVAGTCTQCGEPAGFGKTQCPTCLRRRSLEHRQIVDKVIAGYGGQCKCCKETERDFLTLDHVYNDGAEHRRFVGKGATGIYRWALKHNFPDSLQLLCFNCNCGKERCGGVCPHQLRAKHLEASE